MGKNKNRGKKQGYSGQNAPSFGAEQEHKKPPHYQITVQNHVHTDPPPKEKTWSDISLTNRITIILTAIIAAAGIFAGVVYFCQLRVTQKSVKETQDQFRMDQRPRIAAVEYTSFDASNNAIGAPVIGHPFGVSIVLKNLGKSTALHLYIHRHIVTGKDYPERIKVEPPDLEKTNLALETQTSTTTSVVASKDTYQRENINFPPEDQVNWDGVLPIVVFGRVTYEDAFGTLYCTSFAASYINSGAWVNLSDFRPKNLSLAQLCSAGTQ